MKKVFVKRIMDGLDCFPLGFESEVVDGFVHSKNGVRHNVRDFFDPTRWQHIERDCFEHGGEVWFHNTNDEKAWPPFGATIILLFDDDFQLAHKVGKVREERFGESPIGWRYAREPEAKPVYSSLDDSSVAAIDPALEPHKHGIIKEGYFNKHGVPNYFHVDCSFLREGVIALIHLKEGPGYDVLINGIFSERYTKMRLLAMEDSHLTPAQRRHWDKMQAKQAAKEQLKKDAEDKALHERAKQLSDAGNAMDRVNQDHGHKLGWMGWQLK